MFCAGYYTKTQKSRRSRTCCSKTDHANYEPDKLKSARDKNAQMLKATCLTSYVLRRLLHECSRIPTLKFYLLCYKYDIYEPDKLKLAKASI